MKYVRIKLYSNGNFTSCEECYLGTDHVKALERFHQDHPCANRPECNCVAETIDSDNPSWKEYFDVARRCGALN